MARYRKRPVVVDAMQYKGPHLENYDYNMKLFKWIGASCEWDAYALAIYTKEGKMTASPGDWIIKGVKGEFYPCKPDIFEITYEKLDDVQESGNSN